MNKPNPKQMEALRLRIAELCGRDVKACPVHGMIECCGRGKLPNYPEELNACHEAMACLQSIDWMEQFSKHLFQIVDGERFPDSVPDNWFAVFDTLNAEPWQRCIALDRTLSEEPIL